MQRSATTGEPRIQKAHCRLFGDFSGTLTGVRVQAGHSNRRWAVITSLFVDFVYELAILRLRHNVYEESEIG